MNLRGFVSDDSAVSPVIAVLLMVAITVVLSSVVFIGVNQMSEDNLDERTPNIRLDFEFNDYDDSQEDELSIIHDGGPTIEIGPAEETGTVLAGNLYIRATHPYEDDTSDENSGFECPHDDEDQWYTCSFNFDNDFSVDESMSAGDTFKLTAVNETTSFEEAKVIVVYRSDDGGSSATIGEWTGPEYEED